jgi:HAD superfamily phosphoserine phosphatase-like hydrolase
MDKRETTPTTEMNAEAGTILAADERAGTLKDVDEGITEAVGDYPVVCFDLDGTLVQGTVFIWKSLHEHFQTDEIRRNEAKDAFFSGRLSYQKWFENDLELLAERGADRKRIAAMIKRSIHPTPGALETLQSLRNQGRKLAILSGSLDIVLSAYFSVDLFDVVFLNRVSFDHAGKLSGGVHTPYDLEKKADGLREISKRCGVDLSKCAFVGDNFNDLSAARIAGRAIAFCSRSEELREVADVVVDEPDMRAILPHLG